LSFRVDLPAEEIPRFWYNILSDLGEIPPMLNPRTKEPLSYDALKVLFPEECVRQEGSKERRIQIPEKVREQYLKIGRPTPLFRAKGLENYLRTPAKIFYKREDVTPTGSHKLNTALAQAYYAREEGTERLTTETGAGQWGSALSYAGAMFDLNILVFMVRVSYNQKPYRKFVMKLYGAEVVPSPSDRTEVGRKFLKENPEHPGSLGIAISEAIEVAIKDERTKY